MNDPRNAVIARTVVRHSLKLEPEEVVLIESFDLADGLVHDLIDAVQEAKGIPLVYLRRNSVIRRQLMGATERQLAIQADVELHQMKQAQAYVGLRAADNVSELADVPSEKTALHGRLVGKPVHSDYRVKHTKWVVMRYPSPSMAQLAGMSTEQFERYYYDVCSVDYARMAEAMVPLVRRMEATDRVRITGPGTDLSFSIKGIGVVPCEGRRNIPDGECFTAPVRDSVTGTIAYNTPSLYLGTTFNQIRFRFEGGRIVEALGDPQDKLDAVMASDDGARYIGEFSLGFNPYVLHPIKDTLFDEKIAGSFHFTPGQAYDTADNGNRSQVHWDLVAIQRPEYGGGEVWFDGERVRKDGRFVVPELEGLNPERLGAR